MSFFLAGHIYDVNDRCRIVNDGMLRVYGGFQVSESVFMTSVEAHSQSGSRRLILLPSRFLHGIEIAIQFFNTGEDFERGYGL